MPESWDRGQLEDQEEAMLEKNFVILKKKKKKKSKIKASALTASFQNCTELLVNAIRKEKINKSIQCGKEEKAFICR